MWRQILVWLLNFALSRLGEDLDAQAKAQLDDYNRRKTEATAAEEKAAIELGEIEQEQRELQQKWMDIADKIDQTETIINEQQKRLDQLNDKREKNLADLARASDDDILHSSI